MRVCPCISERVRKLRKCIQFLQNDAKIAPKSFQSKEKELVDILDTLAQVTNVNDREMAKCRASMMQLVI